MKRILLLMALLSMSSAAPAAAQQARDDNPFGRYLFPPELIMQNQQTLQLTDRQREQLRQEIQKAQSTFTDVQFRLMAEGEKLEKLLQASAIEEQAVLAQVETILQLEREVKRTQVGLLVRLRNLLTESQRARLTELRPR